MAPTMLTSRLALVNSPAQAIKSASASRYVPDDAWQHVRRSLRLSDRELGIVQGIFADKEENSIATTLGISRELVYRLTQRIYVKLRIGSRRELKSKVESEYLAYAGTCSTRVMAFHAR